MNAGWLRVTLLLAVTFAAGAMAGVAYDRHSRAPAMPMPDSKHFVQHLQVQLSLDSAQQRQVAAILARHQYAVDSAWRAMQPHVSVALDSVANEVLAVLRPDQAEKFRRLTHEMHPGMHSDKPPSP